MTAPYERHVSLAPFTSLGLGGPAKYFARVRSRAELHDALAWARAEREPVRVLGGGSNLVIDDAGVAGLVIKLDLRGLALTRDDARATLEAQAGEPWQDVVELALSEDLSGLECLTGIPGSTGATPIQNVGAYGQEVSERIEAVEVLDRQTLTTRWLTKEACGFAYRDSVFKRRPDENVVLAVRFALTPHGKPQVRYAELARALASRDASTPSLREVALAVRGLRASKSMLLDPADENGRSAGSFFMNPVLSRERAQAVKARALAAGLVMRLEDVPAYDAGPGFEKLAAAWLIEKAGVQKGLRRGPVGISSKHTLALVHHGGGSSAQLLALADEVRAQVARVFDVELKLEPVRW